MSGADLLHAALDETFPPVSFRMAYGSSVFHQKNHDSSSSLLDLVFAVDDSEAWHAANIERNPQHYSGLQWLGASTVANFQRNYGAGIYYNTLVPLETSKFPKRMIKYGVVDVDTLCSDLTDWRTLYLSGRMHKPVHVLQTTDAIAGASTTNLRHAVNYALLCLPPTFTYEDLYMRIARISYLGDFRMTFGENPKKVKNIVDGNYHAFEHLYQPILETCPYLKPSHKDDGKLLAGTDSVATKEELTAGLPSAVRRKIGSRSVASKKQLERAVASIVQRYSRTQSIKSIATAGLVKSVQYVGQKLHRTYIKTK